MKFLGFLFLIFLTLSCHTAETMSRPASRSGSPGGVVTTSEKNEFLDLMRKDAIDKDSETAEVLTYLLNATEPGDPYTAAVIENPSHCDIVFRMVEINSGRIYNLPIPRNGRNQFKIAKGDYTLRAKVCNGNFYTQKRVREPLLITLKKL